MSNSKTIKTVRVETNPLVKINLQDSGQWFAIKEGKLLGAYNSRSEAVYAVKRAI